MLAPIGEQGQEQQEEQAGIGWRRRNPDRERTGAAYGDVGPPTQGKEGELGEGLGQEVAAEIEEGEGEERKKGASSSYTLHAEPS